MFSPPPRGHDPTSYETPLVDRNGNASGQGLFPPSGGHTLQGTPAATPAPVLLPDRSLNGSRFYFEETVTMALFALPLVMARAVKYLFDVTGTDSDPNTNTDPNTDFATTCKSIFTGRYEHATIAQTQTRITMLERASKKGVEYMDKEIKRMEEDLANAKDARSRFVQGDERAQFKTFLSKSDEDRGRFPRKFLKDQLYTDIYLSNMVGKTLMGQILPKDLTPEATGEMFGLDSPDAFFLQPQEALPLLATLAETTYVARPHVQAHLQKMKTEGLLVPNFMTNAGYNNANFPPPLLINLLKLYVNPQAFRDSRPSGSHTQFFCGKNSPKHFSYDGWYNPTVELRAGLEAFLQGQCEEAEIDKYVDVYTKAFPGTKGNFKPWFDADCRPEIERRVDIFGNGKYGNVFWKTSAPLVVQVTSAKMPEMEALMKTKVDAHYQASC